jgi:hypothetical protein
MFSEGIESSNSDADGRSASAGGNWAFVEVFGLWRLVFGSII